METARTVAALEGAQAEAFAQEFGPTLTQVIETLNTHLTEGFRPEVISRNKLALLLPMTPTNLETEHSLRVDLLSSPNTMFPVVRFDYKLEGQEDESVDTYVTTLITMNSELLLVNQVVTKTLRGMTADEMPHSIIESRAGEQKLDGETVKFLNQIVGHLLVYGTKSGNDLTPETEV